MGEYKPYFVPYRYFGPFGLQFRVWDLKVLGFGLVVLRV